MKKYLLLLLPFLLLTACDSNPDYANYDWLAMVNQSSPDVNTRFAESMAYNDSTASRDLVADADEYVIYVMTDTHVDSTTHNLDSIIRVANADSRCPLVLHLGDLINAQHHWERFAASAARCTKPFYKTVGNHDLYFNQWKDFRAMNGTGTYCYTITTPSGKKDRFICLDSGSGTLGTQQLKWLRSQLDADDKGGYRHRVVYTHTHVFKQDASQGHTSNYSLEETYELLGLMQQHGIELVMMGHDHSREISTYGGTCYIIVDSAQDPQRKPYYMQLKTGEKLTYDFFALPGTADGLK